MDYTAPIGEAADASYTDANPAIGVEGSAIPAAALENPQREIVAVIAAAGLVASNGNLAQLLAAILALTPADIPFLAGWSGTGAGEDLAVQTYGSVKLARNVKITGEVGQVGVAPVGAAVICDILVNGVSIYTVKPQIAAGATALTAGTLDATKVECSAGDVIAFAVTQTGVAAKGQQALFTVAAVRR